MPISCDARFPDQRLQGITAAARLPSVAVDGFDQVITPTTAAVNVSKEGQTNLLRGLLNIFDFTGHGGLLFVCRLREPVLRSENT